VNLLLARASGVPLLSKGQVMNLITEHSGLRPVQDASGAGKEDAFEIYAGPLWIEQLERERTRQRLCNLVIIIYYLLILEGALRKWIAPSYQRPLFFIRDPFVIWVYVIALSKVFWPRLTFLFWCGLALSMLALGSIVVHAGSVPLVIMAYGWRNYFAYVPLAFIIGEQFTSREWSRMVKFTFLIAAPMALLCVIQSVSSVTSPINAGFGNTPDDMFLTLGVAGHIIRASGTFSSTAGLNEYVGSLFALSLWVLMARGTRRRIDGKLAFATLAAVTILITCGSRGAFVLVLVLLVGATALLIMKHKVRRALSLWTAGIVLVGLTVLGGLMFARQSSALLERSRDVAQEDSWYSFGLLNRALSDFTHFATFMSQVDVLGNGLGLGGNAANMEKLQGNLPEAEDDWSRNIVDLGPVLGLLYIIFRIAFVAWLVWGAARTSRLYDDPLPVLLISFIGITMLYGQITGQGTINCYAWLFAGFCMAANAGRLTDSGPETPGANGAYGAMPGAPGTGWSLQYAEGER